MLQIKNKMMHKLKDRDDEGVDIGSNEGRNEVKELKRELKRFKCRYIVVFFVFACLSLV